jgi:uncharacterized membrane protein
VTAEPSRLEGLVARVLGIGLGVSVAALALGLALTLTGLAPAVAADRLLRWGLIILMATPMARVVVSAGTYAVEGDWKYFLITLSVLAVLAISVITALNIG